MRNPEELGVGQQLVTECEGKRGKVLMTRRATSRTGFVTASAKVLMKVI
jgi:hypothetical protein